VNQFITPRASLSYGGLKLSGLGKENTLEAMLEHFTSSKTVIINPRRPCVRRTAPSPSLTRILYLKRTIISFFIFAPICDRRRDAPSAARARDSVR
jgi:hypothetical protein